MKEISIGSNDLLWRNINTGSIISDKDYQELLLRESNVMWEEMNEEEKDKWTFEEFYEYLSSNDTDFEPVDKDGNKVIPA